MAIRQTLPGAHSPDLLGGIVSTKVHRLFFALMPDATTRTQLVRIADALKTGHPRLRPLDQAHPLSSYAAFPWRSLDAAAGYAEAAAGSIRTAPFEWLLDHAAGFH